MTDQDWGDAERELPSAGDELARLYRRARRHLALTLALTFLATAAVVGYVAHKPRSYQSRIVFRITEGKIESQTALHINRRLREYVAEVVFNNQRLLEIIKANHLYPSLIKRDETLALEMMREDLDVEVWRNYLALPRMYDAAERSARLAITFHGGKKVQVFETVTALGQLILEHERNSRVAQAEVRLHMADEAALTARNLVAQRKQLLAELVRLRQQSPSTAHALELVIEENALARALSRAEALVDKTNTARERAYVRLQLEKRALGLRFELIDGGRVAAEGMSNRLRLLVVAGVMLVLALPLCGMAVGAWDNRIYDADDVLRLGVGVVGTVRRFDGDDAGSLAARQRLQNHDNLERS